MQRLRTVYFEFPYTETDSEPKLLIIPTATIELGGKNYRVLERRKPNGELDSIYVPGAIKTIRAKANGRWEEVHAEVCREVSDGNEGLALYRKLRDRYPSLRTSGFEIDGYRIPEGIDGIDFMDLVVIDGKFVFDATESFDRESGLLSRMRKRLFG
ncbi:hypothetical protein J4413_04400 [Candidatus Woesearchaeota archaeon]|nr:hypothetical protein [Candidatus Woesearchaeota archaeon]